MAPPCNLFHAGRMSACGVGVVGGGGVSPSCWQTVPKWGGPAQHGSTCCPYQSSVAGEFLGWCASVSERWAGEGTNLGSLPSVRRSRGPIHTDKKVTVHSTPTHLLLTSESFLKCHLAPEQQLQHSRLYSKEHLRQAAAVSLSEWMQNALDCNVLPVTQLQR